ncbi:MAG: SDR family oxidoreductase [Acidobacteriota bacterium]|jgi:Nucleoside-diphosphate-sugar epimerases|nr:SDR family oxidoreductase [Acidobacteriota bacterium]MDD8029573.1 SDR family oxidoreductase [Acidobacteriota bacterium]MDD8033586.1 SDR family oxidoreductase [Acidobacteriota bacterium]MDD8037885.1 SDR family oxidoreductase [Acidobacteriota bacterium]OQB57731.1 MAG: UDP-glucose 4-epimerase [Candidatus Aminicenantes bacterium ADurb.Bin147]
MSRYLVTGGAGFIGSHLVETLLDRGEEVRVLDNFLTGKRENLASFGGRLELLEGDLRDPDACRRAVDGVDFVLHEAALPSVPRSVADPFTTDEINVRGTLNLLWAAARAKVRRLVFASSSSVYGDAPGLPKREGEEGKPLSPYAASKWAGEKYLQVFAKTFDLETVSLRYFNVFGPRQDPASQYAAAVPLFITRILRGEAPTVFGDGEQSRDFTYVANVVEANLLACTAGGAAGGVFNVACADRITVNVLIAKINEILGKSIAPVYAAPRPGDIRHSFADISAAERELGYRPVVGFEEGLRRTIAWCGQRGNHR